MSQVGTTRFAYRVTFISHHVGRPHVAHRLKASSIAVLRGLPSNWPDLLYPLFGGMGMSRGRRLPYNNLCHLTNFIATQIPFSKQ